MFKNLLGYWYLKKKISNGFFGEGLVSIKSKKINNFCYEEKSLIHKKAMIVQYLAIKILILLKIKIL
jgi:hypothetical protein